MLFNSYTFIFIFLPITLFTYFTLNRLRLTEAGKAFLVFASLFFYSWWNIAYLPLILVSILFNYLIGISLTREQEHRRISKKILLSIGVVGNVALLAYFKYTDFFIENFNLAFDGSVPLMHLVLPLGISFFTFTQIAFLVDSYRGEVKEYNLLYYMLFVTYFPHLLAGPILHHKEMMPQFGSKWNFAVRWRNVAMGLFLFSIGIFKKVVIADTFAQWANTGFDTATALNLIEAWVTSLSYTFQLYFDFSGYTDMAIGVSLLFNIKLPINFNSPYKATSIQDFWRRWHMTLSRFLRDYVYIPLGGNRGGVARTYINLMATFVIGGIWHGAGWTFVFWGFLHGMAIVIHRAWNQMGMRMPSVLAWFITFNFINVTWVFFRAKEWGDAMKVLEGMFFGAVILPVSLQDTLTFLSPYGVKFGLGLDMAILWWISGALVLVVAFKNSNQMTHGFKPNYLTALFAVILFLTSAASLYKLSEFLYFNF